ncbi:MAG: hypothetical protein KTR31_16555 [Myxococcales bacterium]|nr:hypothetical protein [Myxococcales bacterium]
MLSTEMGVVEADLYRPSGSPWATVLMLHGLARHAHRDPRLVRLATALTAAGMAVVSPRIEPLAQLRLKPLASPTIAATLRSVLADDTLDCSSVGILAPSYAGGQAMAAAATPELRQHVSGLMLIGAYHDARALLRHLLVEATADPYGRLILLRRFLDEVGELTDGIALAIHTDLTDSIDQTEQLPQVLRDLTPHDREHFLTLRDDAAARSRLCERLLADHAEAVDALSVTHAIPDLLAPVTLFHGRNDLVIPPTESARLHELLSQQGKRSRLCTTTLLDHGNVSFSLGTLLEGPATLATFAHWFGSLRGPLRNRR